MLGIEDVAIEARATYEAFDCAKAVALIGFIGLLSNFQDTIDDFTNLLNMGRRRRSDDGMESWKNIVYSAIEAFQHGSRDTSLKYVAQEEASSEQEEDLRQTDNTVVRDIQDSSDEKECLWSSELPDPEYRRPLIQDLARTGPMVAMWLVDTGDGRVSGKEGRSRVCQITRSFTDDHGWLGSLVSHLLTSTLAVAISEHQDSKELLDQAGLSAGTMGC